MSYCYDDLMSSTLVDRTIGRTHMLIFFFFNDTATTEIYTLSLHDALPICLGLNQLVAQLLEAGLEVAEPIRDRGIDLRSEEHTSELQSHLNLVCRLLLEKKKHTQSGHDRGVA